MKMRLNNPLLYKVENGEIIEKTCPLCKVLLSIENYHRNKSRPHGIAPYCKSCVKILYKKRWVKYREVSKQSIARRRLQAFEIVADGREKKCVAHSLWSCCGDPFNALFLSLDHIENDGFLHKKELNTTSSTTIYNWIIKNPELARTKLQILCMNAQTMKKRIYSKDKTIVYFPYVTELPVDDDDHDYNTAT